MTYGHSDSAFGWGQKPHPSQARVVMSDSPWMAELGSKKNTDVAPGMAAQIYFTTCIRH